MFRAILVVFLILGFLPFQFVYAACSDLSLRFSQDTKNLTVDELAELTKCITTKIKEKPTLSHEKHKQKDTSCSNLALIFSKEPDSLTINELESLLKYVEAQLEIAFEKEKRVIPPCMK